MWYSQTDKSHRTAEGGGYGCEHACNYQQPVAYSHDVYTQILSISVTQHQGVKWFYQQ